MTEPTTPNAAFIVPNTGDLPGAWGTSALNPNLLAQDGLRGGATTISLSIATTIALTAPSASITPSAGPTQQQNALLRFTGTQSGNAVITFTMPGQFVIDNQCVGTSFYVQLGPASGTGNFIGVPPGKKTLVFFDGTSMDFLNPPDPGTAYDLHTNVDALPVWMNACSVKPYLVKDGSGFNVSQYPALAAQLGSTYGGNGITTFGVPDERSRFRLPLDNTGTAGRVTSAGSGIDGRFLGQAGGSEFTQQHNHPSPAVHDPTHNHVVTPPAGTNPLNPSSGVAYSNSGGAVAGSFNTANSSAGITLDASTGLAGAGFSQNMPPTIVSFLALIKT